MGRFKNLFMGSLFVNVLLGGLVLGYGFKHWQEGSFSFAPQAKISQEEILGKLSTDEVRELVLDTFQDIKTKSQPYREQLSETRIKIIEVVSAENFDETSFVLVTNQLHALRAQMKKNNTVAIRDLAKQCGKEDRAVLAEILQRN